MIILGIDPGLTGAIAMLDHNGLRGLEDMPVMPRGPGGAYVKRQVNAAALSQILRAWLGDQDKNAIRVLIESVTAIPKQGLASTFSLALTAGLIEGVVSAHGWPHELVRPQEWKRAMGLSAAKDQARAKAARLYPMVDLSLKKSHNRAEAILIARYGYDKHA